MSRARTRHEHRSPSALSRGGNHGSPTSPLLTTRCGGTSRFPHTPSPRSWARGWPMSSTVEQLADELSQLFTLLVRTDSALADETAMTTTQRLALGELARSGPLRLGALAERI